jgi:hypothetical protein
MGRTAVVAGGFRPPVATVRVSPARMAVLAGAFPLAAMRVLAAAGSGAMMACAGARLIMARAATRALSAAVLRTFTARFATATVAAPTLEAGRWGCRDRAVGDAGMMKRVASQHRQLLARGALDVAQVADLACVENASAAPSAPARAVRPMRCT